MIRWPILVIAIIFWAVLFTGVCAAFAAGNGYEPASGSFNGNGNEPSSGTMISNSYMEVSYGDTNSGNEPGMSYSPAPSSVHSQPPTEPLAGDVPSNMPSASIDSGVPYLYHGQNPSLDDLRKIGGNAPFEMNYSSTIKLQYYLLYNNVWCQNPVGFWYNQKTNSLMYIDRPQDIWAYEKYPDGEVILKDLGYWNEGYHTGWFSADAKGWHRLAIFGSGESRWSNVLWIYVW